jgi:hypothetical protein
MFKNKYTRWLAGATLALALTGNLIGAGSAFAASTPLTHSSPDSRLNTGDQLAAQVQAKLTVNAPSALTPGAAFTYNLTLSNMGPGTAMNTVVTLPLNGNIAIDSFTSDDSAAWVQSMDSDAIVMQFGDMLAGSAATATIAAHVSSSSAGAFTDTPSVTVDWSDGQAAKSIQSAAASVAVGSGTPQLPAFTSSAAGPVPAGTLLTFSGGFFAVDETVSFWLNVPSGTTIASSSLGQGDTVVEGSVIPLDLLGHTDPTGTVTYTLDTTGLPSGTYSLVGQGWDSGVQGIVSFTIQ